MRSRARQEHNPHYGRSAYQRIARDAYHTYDDRCVPVLARNLRLPATAMEPAVGEGRMARQLKAAGVQRIVASDIKDYGYRPMKRVSFYDIRRVPEGVADIITNPPNRESVAFAEHALRLMADVDGRVALLVPYAWDAVPGRHALLTLAPLALRIALMFRPWWSDERKATPREDWQWLVWDYRHQGPTEARYG